MDKRVLVAYATKYGATAEIAEKIGAALRAQGLQAVVTSVEQTGDPSQYAAVVLGSAVYAGNWRREAVTFLEANEPRLAERPVWLFSSGPTGEGDPADLMKGWTFPEAQKPLAERIGARDTAFFGGYINMAKLNLAEKLIIKGIKAPVGDYRNWDAITAWASGIAATLTSS